MPRLLPGAMTAALTLCLSPAIATAAPRISATPAAQVPHKGGEPLPRGSPTWLASQVDRPSTRATDPDPRGEFSPCLAPRSASPPPPSP